MENAALVRWKKRMQEAQSHRPTGVSSAETGAPGIKRMRDMIAAFRAEPGDALADDLARKAADILTGGRHVAVAVQAGQVLDRAGYGAAAGQVFDMVARVDPACRDAALFFSRRAERAGDLRAAFDCLSPALAGDEAPHDVMRRAATLLLRLGRGADAVDLALAAWRRFPDEAWPPEIILRNLSGPEQDGRALEIGRVAMRHPQPLPATCLRTYAAAHRLDSPDTSDLRARALAVFAMAENPDLWRARILRLERAWPEALLALEQAVRHAPRDPAAIRELASAALGRGLVGRYARTLVDAIGIAEPESVLVRQIAATERMFASLGGSLALAAEGDPRFAGVTTPGSVFEHVLATLPVAEPSSTRSGLMMFSGSLAAGGAERVVSTIFAEMRRRRPEPVHLCLLHFERDTEWSFYLPQTGLAPEDILVADPVEPVRDCFAWLPRTLAMRSQAMFDLMERHRPAVVHATLDLTNICAGFAALVAGVPRVILHIHNMRPAEIANENAFNPDFDICYRALLARPEVTFVGVADAAVSDYLDWIGAPTGARGLTVHNGFDLESFTSPGAADAAAALRRTLGVAASGLLVGTAFRFTELKRPDWWIAMAIELAARHPDAHFVLFGDGDLRAAAMQRVAAAGLSARIHLPGRISNLPDVIGALDLFVLTSRTEGLPNVLIEAQAAGVPVVSFDVGGVRETMLAGVTGTLLPASMTCEDLVEAVDARMRDRDWLAATRGRAREFVRGRFDIGRMADRMEELFFMQPPATQSDPQAAR